MVQGKGKETRREDSGGKRREVTRSQLGGSHRGRMKEKS